MYFMYKRYHFFGETESESMTLLGTVVTVLFFEADKESSTGCGTLAVVVDDAESESKTLRETEDTVLCCTDGAGALFTKANIILPTKNTITIITIKISTNFFSRNDF